MFNLLASFNSNSKKLHNSEIDMIKSYNTEKLKSKLDSILGLSLIFILIFLNYKELKAYRNSFQTLKSMDESIF